MNFKPLRYNIFRLIINILWVYVAYFLCRICFIFENSSIFEAGSPDYATLLRGGFLFDTSAICYTNVLFIVLFLIAGFFANIRKWVKVGLRILYTVVNSFCIIINLADSVFFATRLQRSTAATLREFEGEGNLLSIASEEVVSHWYFIIIGGLLAWGLWKLFLLPHDRSFRSRKGYIFYSLSFIIIGFLTLCGMRGSFFFEKATRPISVNFAFTYTTVPAETGIVLNTPFSIIRTMGESAPRTPDYFSSDDELAAIYSPLHLPADSLEANKKNIVIIIMESFSREFVGGLNKELEGGTYRGYTPFIDEMLDSCMWFDEMIANTFFSIDAPPALLASIPRADRPFTVSPHSLNHINSITSELKNWGYNSSFFHGADNESLGINAFVKQAGFDNYYGKNEFLADKRFGGDAEYDGKWGIWDEPFLQFFCITLSETPEPFVASVFTLSSHHPFKVPEKYKDVFVDEGIFPLHKAVKYSDFALRRFFDEARTQPWFMNTIFIISADHTSSKRTHDEYKNEMGDVRIPILIYDPSGKMPRGKQPGIFQQIDVMPTLLGYVGYDRPYIAFGKDILSVAPEDTWGFNWNSLPFLIKGDYAMVLEDGSPIRFYNYKTDPLHETDLLGKGLPEEKEMEQLLKAIVQSYLERMNDDKVTVRDN